ncbi:MAG: hypothetical protein ACRDJH_12905 [Thermomicrobiales bacterium]
MIEVERIALLPTAPAVYAMYGGRGPGLYIAYVGVADNLRRRAEQHLVRRSSSVTTGVATVGLDPDNVTELRWWTDPTFAKRIVLEAAELVAFDVLDPALRSRGRVTAQAQLLYADEAFHERMEGVIGGPPAGRLVLPTLQDALDRIAALERRLDEIANRLG